MPEEIINKKIADQLMALEGEVRGMAVKSHGEFIRLKRGEKELKELEKMMSKLGHPVEYQKIESMRFYPIGLEALTLVVIKELFDFGNKEFEELGVFSSKFSLIIKFFMKYFVSLKLTAKQASNIWKRYYTIGDFNVIDLNEKEKYVILRLENFQVHPLHCLHLKGYCAGVIKMIVKNPVTCKEIKCSHKGDDYHEFLLKWE